MKTPENIPGFYDIYEPLVTPISLWWLVLPLILAFLLLGVWWWRRRRIVAFVSLTLWDQAFSRLNGLRLPQSHEEFRTFYLELTTIIKEYLECRYGISLHEKTDDEVMKFLAHQVRVPAPVVERVRALFTRASIIKFSEQHPMTDVRADLDQAQIIVTLTVPQQTVATT